MNKFLLLFYLASFSLSAFANNKMVVGTDDRIQIKKKNKIEAHESIGIVYYRDKGKTYSCTGTIIAPKVVITAAHCIEPSFDIYFIPGQISRIWGGLNKTSKNAVKAKITRIFPGYYYDDPTKGDLGLLIFHNEFKVKPLALSTQYAQNEVVSIAGYPEDKPLGTLWEGTGEIDGASYTIDTYGGQSGSALRNKDNEIIGIHSHAVFRKQKNFACMLTPEHIEFIEKYIE